MISPHFYPAVGGVETHLTDLCKFLASKKHTVYVRTYQALTSKEKGKIHEETAYLKIHRLPWPDFNLYFKLDKYPILKFLYVFTGLFFDSLIFLLKNSQKIDVIQAHGLITAFGAVILGKIFRKRVVVNTHVNFKFNSSFMTKVITWALKNSDQILVLTESAKRSLVKLGIPEEKIAIYHYWVDQKIFYKRKDAKKILCWDKKFVVLFVGRLIEVKGVKVIFDLAKRQKNITFVIVGSGPLAEEFQSKAGEYPNILFLGKVKNDDLPLYYSAADLLLIPSKMIEQEYEEGIPRVMIEAISCGLPVITTPSGGIPDVFNVKIGMIVKDDVNSVNNAIEWIFKRRGIFKKVSKECRSFAVANFGIKNSQVIEKTLASDQQLKPLPS